MVCHFLVPLEPWQGSLKVIMEESEERLWRLSSLMAHRLPNADLAWPFWQTAPSLTCHRLTNPASELGPGPASLRQTTDIKQLKICILSSLR